MSVRRCPPRAAAAAYGRACAYGGRGQYGGPLCSGQVLVQVGVAGVALEVLARDEVLDALLDLLRVGLEVAHQLRRRLEDELLVLEAPAGSHGPVT